VSAPPAVIRSTEIWLLPGSTASSRRPPGRNLQRPLACQAAASPCSAGWERRACHRRQRPIGVAVESGDGVGAGRVVIHVDVSHHPGWSPRLRCWSRSRLLPRALPAGRHPGLVFSASCFPLRSWTPLAGRPANASKLGQGVLPTCVRAITRRELAMARRCGTGTLSDGKHLGGGRRAVVRDVLSRYLTREGYTVSEAADGEEALSAIRSEPAPGRGARP